MVNILLSSPFLNLSFLKGVFLNKGNLSQVFLSSSSNQPIPVQFFFSFFFFFIIKEDDSCKWKNENEFDDMGITTAVRKVILQITTFSLFKRYE